MNETERNLYFNALKDAGMNIINNGVHNSYDANIYAKNGSSFTATLNTETPETLRRSLREAYFGFSKDEMVEHYLKQKINGNENIPSLKKLMKDAKQVNKTLRKAFLEVEKMMENRKAIEIGDDVKQILKNRYMKVASDLGFGVIDGLSTDAEHKDRFGVLINYENENEKHHYFLCLCSDMDVNRKKIAELANPYGPDEQNEIAIQQVILLNGLEKERQKVLELI